MIEAPAFTRDAAGVDFVRGARMGPMWLGQSAGKLNLDLPPTNSGRFRFRRSWLGAWPWRGRVLSLSTSRSLLRSVSRSVWVVRSGLGMVPASNARGARLRDLVRTPARSGRCFSSICVARAYAWVIVPWALVMTAREQYVELVTRRYRQTAPGAPWELIDTRPDAELQDDFAATNEVIAFFGPNLREGTIAAVIRGWISQELMIRRWRRERPELYA